MLLCELWVHLASPERDSPGAVGHFLSTRPPPTHLPGRWPRPCAVAGSGILVGQPSWNVKQPLQLPPPPPALCSLTLWLGAVYRSGSDPEVIIGNGFQEDAQQLVSRSEPADKIRVFPDFVGLLSDSPDLVFDQSLLCYFLQLHKTS